jgi:hypothetical protein
LKNLPSRVEEFAILIFPRDDAIVVGDERHG